MKHRNQQVRRARPASGNTRATRRPRTKPGLRSFSQIRLLLAGLALLLASGRARAQAPPTIGRNVNGVAGDVCNPACDLYQIDYHFDGTFNPDETGPYPKKGQWTWPCDPRGWPSGKPATGVDCAASVGSTAGPRVFTFAMRIHNAKGWSGLNVQSFVVTIPDVNPYADWIEWGYHRGITAGCGGDKFCPSDPVTRDKMMVFLTKAIAEAVAHPELYPPGWTPPPCSGVFSDVRCAHVTYSPTVWPTLPATPTPTAVPPTPPPPSRTPSFTRTPFWTATKTRTPTKTVTPGGPTLTPTPFNPCTIVPCTPTP